MTNLSQWKQALQIHFSVFKAVLQQILQQKLNITVKQAETGNAEEVIPLLQAATKIIHLNETTFSSDVFFGFGSGWASVSEQLNHALSSASKNKEQPLLLFSEEILTIIADGLTEVDIKTELSGAQVVTQDEIANLTSADNFFSAHLQAELANDAEPLELWVVMTQPDQKSVTKLKKKFGADNPFQNDQYAKIMKKQTEQHLQNDIQSRRPETDRTNQGQPVEFEDFGRSETSGNTTEMRNIDLLKNVEMHVSVELGRRKMPLGKILQLVKGSVIELEKLAGEPVEILVNGHKIAQGDVVVIDEHFGVRISNLLASQERIKTLQ